MVSRSDIGARFVACKGWRYPPGMLVFDALGNRHRLVEGSVDAALQYIVGLHGFAFPDTSDPATLGCIEHGLLPEAWPGCAIHVVRWSDTRGCQLATVIIYDMRLAGPGAWEPSGEQMVFAISDTPIAEALLAALEAAPANQEGGR